MSEPLSEGELHAVAHAQWKCESASDNHPEVCFDYTLVKTLLTLIERLCREGAKNG